MITIAKGKYEEWLTPEGLLKLEGWARDGLTDEQIAKNVGVSIATLYNWKKSYLEILEALKRGKEVVDIQVENALLKRALGYEYCEDRYIIEKMPDEEYEAKLIVHMNKYRLDHPEATKEELYAEQAAFPKTKLVVVERKVKEVVPDTTAQIFWLKNRQPEKWRDKKDVEMSGSLGLAPQEKEDIVEEYLKELKADE